jgi:hypothetical protein
MYSYLRLTKCRVCQAKDDELISAIDKDLLSEVPIMDVQAKYGGKFGKIPLTAMSLYSHRKHIRRSVPSAILEIPDLSSAAETGEPTSLARSEGFNTFLGTVVKNREMLDNLVSSAMEDLNASDEYLEDAYGAKNKAIILAIRDKIRDSLAGYIELSKTLTTPEISVAIKGQEGDRVTELLVLVRQAFEMVIADDHLREVFFNELARLIRRSTTLKDIFQAESQKKSE